MRVKIVLWICFVIALFLDVLILPAPWDHLAESFLIGFLISASDGSLNTW